MKTEFYKINNIPTVLYGEPCKQGYLFIHGQDGNKEEAAAFAEIAVPAGYQVLGIDLPQHGERKAMASGFDPWTAVPELQSVISQMKNYWNNISIRANSIGAYFSMLAFPEEPIVNALFVSPIVDMEKLIIDMMDMANVSEDALRRSGEISTDFGQTLSMDYLCWVRKHSDCNWNIPTSILYAGHDNLTSRKTIKDFSEKHNASLEIYESGEHWFHTPDQLNILKKWERENIF